MVVRMRATRAHRNNRRSHHALDPVRVSRCHNCGAEHKSHTLCMNCGHYKGRKVVDIAASSVAKKDKKSKS